MSWFKQIAELWRGDKVNGIIVQKTATLPAATGSVALFAVVGGRVRLVDLVGNIVTPPGGTAATILARLQYDQGGLGAPTNMCVDIADIKAFVAGRFLYITGAVAVAMASAAFTGLALLFSFATNEQALDPGNISLLMTEGAGAAGDIVGAIKWTIKYVPLDAGATIVPA